MTIKKKRKRRAKHKINRKKNNASIENNQVSTFAKNIKIKIIIDKFMNNKI